LCVAFLVGGGSASARYPAVDLDLDVSATVAREVTDFRLEDGRRVESRYTRLGISVWQTQWPWLQPGLTAGVGWISQSGDPATAGYSLSGEWVGLQLRSRVPLGGGLDLVGQAAWVYHQADGEENDAAVELSWYDTEARLGLAARFDRLTLEAGGSWRDVDGERRLPGLETLTFETENDVGAYAGVALWVDPTGYVSVTAETGTREAVRVQFARQF
jgi:hypothetical protein